MIKIFRNDSNIHHEIGINKYVNQYLCIQDWSWHQIVLDVH